MQQYLVAALKLARQYKNFIERLFAWGSILPQINRKSCEHIAISSSAWVKYKASKIGGFPGRNGLYPGNVGHNATIQVFK